jgi:hypothetical protein
MDKQFRDQQSYFGTIVDSSQYIQVSHFKLLPLNWAVIRSEVNLLFFLIIDPEGSANTIVI